MDISNAQRARVLVHALPYIQDYSGKIVVVKYGGNAMVSEHLKDSVIRDICLLQLIGVKVVLVHGGGPEITETLGKMGKKSAFVDGVRVTDEEAVGVALMVLAGFGMFAGNLAGGRLSDRYTPGRVAAWAQGTICVALLLTFFCARVPWLAVALMCVCTTGLFAVSSPQQLLLLRHSEGGELLGAASVQVAFNLGKAIGAYCGGLPLEAGLGYEYPALIGAPFALAGFVLLTVFYRRYEPSGRRPLRHA